MKHLLLVSLLLALSPQALGRQECPAVRADPAAGGGRDGWLEEVTARLAREEYGFSRLEPAVWSAPNRHHDLRTRLEDGALVVFPRATDAGGAGAPWRLRLETVSLGRAGSSWPVPSRAVRVHGAYAEVDRGALVEWFVNDEAGLAQGWTIARRPDGRGWLELGIAVAGELAPTMDEEQGAALFADRSGEPRVRYGGLAAWDAVGRELPVRLEARPPGLRLRVDDAGARYPVTVDPVLSSVVWTAESNQQGAYFGWAVASAGDVNGDGYDDVIVGARLYDRGQANEGRAFAYLGSASGLGSSPIWSAEGNQGNAGYGYSVASAGDVNGDGFDDVIVGANAYDNGEDGEGRAWVYHGNATGIRAQASWTAEANQTSAAFGQSVDSADDVNGDGFDDVIVGSSGYSNGEPSEGRAWVYHGSASGLGAIEAWTAEPNQPVTWFGRAVAGAGDVNGDGYADVIVGARYYTNGESNEGGAFVYHGSAAGLGTTAAWSAESNQAAAGFGESVAGAGDVNGDGFDDVIVGADQYDNGQLDEGRAYVYHGSPGGLDPVEAWTAEPDQENAWLGHSVSGAGDVDGDGYDDVIVGAWYWYGGQADEGRVYVHHGSATGLAATAAWFAGADQEDARFGESVGCAGDVNGDGYDDVIVGSSWFDNGQPNEGRAFVYPGSTAGLLKFAAPVVATRNAGTNPASYVAGPAVVGQTWSATVDVSLTGHTHAQVLGFASPSVIALPAGQSLLGTGARVFALPLAAGPTAAWSVPVPDDPSLCGLTVHTQAAHLFGVTPFVLTNAQDLTLGM